MPPLLIHIYANRHYAIFIVAFAASFIRHFRFSLLIHIDDRHYYYFIIIFTAIAIRFSRLALLSPHTLPPRLLPVIFLFLSDIDYYFRHYFIFRYEYS